MIERIKSSKKYRIYCLIALLFIILALLVAIPSLGRFQSKVVSSGEVWDGSVASSYRDGSGTFSDPYIISNGSELALFASSLESNDYNDTYFALGNDIILNDGLFLYDNDNKLRYVKDDVTYYVSSFGTELYTDSTREGNVAFNINKFSSLNNFKGHFDGNSHTIYGLYIADANSSNVSFFTNLEGEVTDLYFSNSVVNGNFQTAGVAVNATNASLSNVLYDGYIIGSDDSSLTTDINIDDIVMDSSRKTVTTNVSLEDIEGTVISVSLLGSTNSLNNLTINGKSITTNDFSLELDLDNYNELELETSDYQNTTLSNLRYSITYSGSSTSGIVDNVTDTSLTNVVNKADIYAKTISSGLVGKASNIDIINSYNSGNLYADNITSGLITELSGNDNTISNSYNSGVLNSLTKVGLINNVSNASVTIENVFNASSSTFLINNVLKNSSVTINNSYYIEGEECNKGSLIGTFTLVDNSSLLDKNFLIDTLEFKEFVNSEDLLENPSNLFIYEDNRYPLLYFDEVLSSSAKISISEHTYNNFSNELESLKYTDTINFTISNLDDLTLNRELYYYIYNGDSPLTKEDVMNVSSWVPYEGIGTIDETGSYIIYVKAIDYSDNVSYINTDILVLDNTPVNIEIKMDDLIFDSFTTSLDEVYVNKDKTLTVSATDDLSSVDSIEYYISPNIMSKEELDKVSFSPYEEEISLNTLGRNIVYVKITDNFGYVTYANTDYINYTGYEINKLMAGNSSDNIDDLKITDKSSASLNITYKSDLEYKEGDQHALVSNIKLPLNTKITITDNINEKVYTYVTTDDNYGYTEDCTDCKATYPFNLFKEVGTLDDNSFVEMSSGTLNEDYTVNVSFANTDLTDNILDVKISLILKDKDDNIVLDTLDNSIKTFDVYTSKDASIHLTTTDVINNINYNSNSSTEINFTSNLEYQKVGEVDVIDTTSQDKNLMLILKLIDSNGDTVSEEHLKNITFKVNDTLYYPDDSSVVKINLDSLNYDGKLVIETVSDNSTLNKGTYNFEINSALSLDGIYEDKVSDDTINIPVIVDNEVNDYGFEILDSLDNKIISKQLKVKTLDFDIIEQASLDDANIRVSLYRKKNFTAYNQDYELIDLNNYINNDLEKVTDSVYYAIKNPVNYDGSETTYNNLMLDFETSSIDTGGYKLVFELYDGASKIGTIEERFIVK